MSDYKLDVLYEDNHIIAINKKASDIVQGDKTGDRPLGEFVKDYLKKKYDKPGEVFLGVVHRLDRPVSGVVLFARTSKGLTRLNEMFRGRDMEKVYWAVVKNRPPMEKDTLIHSLKKNQEKNKSFVCSPTDKAGLKCELTYEILNSSDNYHLLEVTPKTGRHHQIRVQLASIGCPIKGDVKYGYNRTNDDTSIHLHARKLSFIHPIKKEPLEIIAPPPKDALWDFFMKQL